MVFSGRRHRLQSDPVFCGALHEIRRYFLSGSLHNRAFGATDGDGKEFFTITTPSENVFYLIIDRQRDGQNVYFLNAVTEKDLLALAEKDPEPEVTEPVMEPEPETEPPTEPEPEPEPEKTSGFPMGNILMIAAVLLAGGGAGYYFKVYRPKHEVPDMDDEEYDYEDEADPYGDIEEIEETEDGE